MAKFSKQHYIKIANTLSKIKDKEIRKKATEDMSKMFSEDNPRFDSDTFESAVERKTDTRKEYSEQQLRRIKQLR